MATQIALAAYREALLATLTEAFESVHGIFLDRGTSLFETLETVSAEQASRPVSANCACIAAQVEHVRYYLEVLEGFIRGEIPENVDWQGSWGVKHVTDVEWEALKGRLRDQYQQIRTLAESDETWDLDKAVQGSLGLVAHTAYHLGEIRQALCTVRG